MDMIKNAKRIVIKVGSSLLISEDNSARAAWLKTLAADIAALKKASKAVIVVSSGAVALGRAPLGEMRIREKIAFAVRRRLELHYPGRHHFAIGENDGVVTVRIELEGEPCCV
jgi:glutamate 5-kinase